MPILDRIHLVPVGWVRSSRLEPIDDHWDQVEARIELNREHFTADALLGLASFSHVEILFFMNQVDPEKIELSARHPRNNADWPKVGIFAQRGKNRPNQIGTTICKLQKVDELTLFLSGLDAIDGTPVLDIKPWVKEFGPRGEVRQPVWIGELMKEYWE
jgi:tRNA-Thr(GGU) m(6)t(6)A37 methyltransferase TsaA